MRRKKCQAKKKWFDEKRKREIKLINRSERIKYKEKVTEIQDCYRRKEKKEE